MGWSFFTSAGEKVESAVTLDGFTSDDFVKVADNVTVPTGVVQDYAGTAAPTGWLLCDGTLKLQSAFPALFAVIGHAFNGGVDPGGGQFRLPSTLGRVTVGRDAAQVEFDTLGESGGAKTQALTAAQLPVHTHGSGTLVTAAAGDHSHTSGTLATDTAAAHTHSDGTYVTASAGSHSHTVGTNDVIANFTQTSGGSNFDPGAIRVGDNSSRYNAAIQVSSHNHSLTTNGAHTHTITGNSGSAGSHSHAVNSGSTATTGSHTHTVTGSTGDGSPTLTGAAHNNLQPYLVLNKIIKT